MIVWHVRHIREQGWFYPDSKVHGNNMGPTWVLLALDGPRVGPMKLAIWVGLHPANERRCYCVTTPLIGWAQTRISPDCMPGILSWNILTLVVDAVYNTWINMINKASQQDMSTRIVNGKASWNDKFDLSCVFSLETSFRVIMHLYGCESFGQSYKSSPSCNFPSRRIGKMSEACSRHWRHKRLS